MVDALGHSNFGPNVVFEALGLYIYIYICIYRPPVGHGRPLEATEASSYAQVLAWTEPSPLATPPGPLRLRLFGEA